MTKGRLEAFSDGVLAIIITIMVLEMKVPLGSDFSALHPLWPVFLSYVLSYLYLAIYWNNHHHMLHGAKRINGKILWANLHLLFWLSLVPFVTGWMGENQFDPLPTALYGVILLFAALAYWTLQQTLIAEHGKDSTLARAVGTDWKGKSSPLIYLAAIPACFLHPAIGGALYLLVALIWLIPDPRIERALKEEAEHTNAVNPAKEVEGQ
ncbi:MAG: TMEM175 family protein, partial [Bdellovibrionales bacterium]